MTRKSTEPIPTDHPAWRRLYESYAWAIPRRSIAADAATMRDVASSFDEFIGAFRCGALRAAPWVQTDGLYIDVELRTVDGWVPVVRTHHLNLGLELSELAADAWLADQLGRVDIDVPDVPPAA